MAQKDKAEKKTKPGMNRSSKGWKRRAMTKTVRKGRKKAKELTASARRAFAKAVVKEGALESVPPPASEGIEPLDYEQCQAEKPNGVNFMTLGGRFAMVRCKSKPTTILTDAMPAEDGKVGHMTVCDGCLARLKVQVKTWEILYVVSSIYSLKDAQKKWDSLDVVTRKMFEAHGLKRPE